MAAAEGHGAHASELACSLEQQRARAEEVERGLQARVAALQLTIEQMGRDHADELRECRKGYQEQLNATREAMVRRLDDVTLDSKSPSRSRTGNADVSFSDVAANEAVCQELMRPRDKALADLAAALEEAALSRSESVEVCAALDAANKRAVGAELACKVLEQRLADESELAEERAQLQERRTSPAATRDPPPLESFLSSHSK